MLVSRKANFPSSSSSVCGELDVHIQRVKVVSKLLCILTIKLGVGVVHVPVPPVGAMVGGCNGSLLDVFHHCIIHYHRYRLAHRSSMDLAIELASIHEVCAAEAELEEGAYLSWGQAGELVE